MSEGQSATAIYLTPVFKKALKKLNDIDLEIVEDEIDKIAEEPYIGEQKKGDLSHLWIHKFLLNKQLVLLGYNISTNGITLTLMNLASHENFYKEAKKRRNADLKILGSSTGRPYSRLDE